MSTMNENAQSKLKCSKSQERNWNYEKYLSGTLWIENTTFELKNNSLSVIISYMT